VGKDFRGAVNQLAHPCIGLGEDHETQGDIMRKIAIAAAALAVATTGLAAVQAPAQAGAAWRVTATTTSSQVKVGDKVVFTGKVGPIRAAAGHKVTLQEKFKPGKPWADQRKARVRADGTYRVADKPAANTVHTYRVVMPASARHAKGVSGNMVVKVYGWMPLGAFLYVNADNMYPAADLQMNGTSYPGSVVAASTNLSSVEFNLNHRCIALRGTFGVSDASETGAQSTVTAEADGTPIYSSTLSLGVADVQKLALDSPLKVKFTAQSIVPGADGFGGIGTPQVLCVK
jgi:uncharacterized low-complexity protein